MRIYLAGPCDSDNRTMMQSVASVLREMGLDVYCPFELKIPNAWDYSQEDWAQLVFDADVKALSTCDRMLMVSLGRISSAGTNWEQGYAYAMGIPVCVLQVTDQPTSLMTFCGCDYFTNCTKEELPKIAYTAIMHYQLLAKADPHCETVLT